MLDRLGNLLDGIIGPGSEWFWAAAQFVVVVVSLGGIYRQLRAQGTANAFHQMATLHERWDSERLIRARLALASHLRSGDHSARPTLAPICDFFEDIALLEARGHLSRKDVWEDWNRTVEFWWSVLAPAIHERRSLYPGDFEGFERLSRLMHELDRKAGRVNEFDQTTTSRILDDVVEGLSASLLLELETRTGIVPELPAQGLPPNPSVTDIIAERPGS